MKISGKNIYLSILSEDDVSQNYINWLCDPEVFQYLETKWVKPTIDGLKEYVRNTPIISIRDAPQ